MRSKEASVEVKARLQVFQGIRGASLLLFVVVVVSVLAVLPVEIHKNGLAERIIYSILAFIPIILCSLAAWKNYVIPLFNHDEDDDKLIKLVGVVLTHVAWVTSWALIFQLFWVWQADTWTGVDDETNAYDMWIRMVSTAFLVSTGTGFGPQVAGNWGALLMTAILGYSSFIIGAFLIAASYDVVRTEVEAGVNKSKEKKKIEPEVVSSQFNSNEFVPSNLTHRYTPEPVIPGNEMMTVYSYRT